MGYFFGAVTLILNVYFENWSAEIMVISFGIIHGIGGASVALNLATIAYIGDISTPETKVKILFWFTFQFDFFLYLLDFKKISHHVRTERKDQFNEPTLLISKYIIKMIQIENAGLPNILAYTEPFPSQPATIFR